MAEITLREYIEEIDILIENEQLDEAIAHCLHILQAYPKHIEAYRHLGKALLEAGRFTEAADMFQRVLAAVPDDFVSHVGMSVIREDEGNLDTAIWHMQRAYETSPANTAIKEELKQLIAQREGVAPPKPGLTRGALAQMYVRGELYQEAIVELQASLEEEPDRPDLQVILAEVYWRTGQRVEAAEVCNDLLEELPFCQVANRIMAAMLQASEQAEEGTVYHRRLAALDPYAAFVENAMMDPDTVRDDAVKLKRMDWQPGEPIPAVESGIPDWAAEIGLEVSRTQEEAVEAETEGEIEEPAWLEDIGMAAAGSEQGAPAGEPTGEEAEEELPSWLEEIEPEEEFEPLPEAEEAAGAPPFMDEDTGEEDEGEIPGWMEEAGWRESEGEVEEAHVSFSDEELAALEAGVLPEDELVEEDQEEELAPAEIPDWLMEIAPSEEIEEEEAMLGAEEDELFAEVLGQEEEAEEEETPDWLSGIESEEVEEYPLEPEEPVGAEEMEPEAAPDWMSGIAPEEEAEVEPAEAAPDWDTVITPEPEETEIAETVEEGAPDWLSGISPEVEAEEEAIPSQQEEPEPEGMEAAEEWAAGETVVDFSGAEEPEPEGEAEADIDWLSGIAAEAEAGEMEVPSGEPEEIEPEEEAAEWLTGIARTAQEMSEDVSEHISEIPGETPEISEEPAGTPPEEIPEEEAPAIPSWLEAEEPGESSTIVSWLGTQELEEGDEEPVEELEDEEPISTTHPFLSAVEETEAEAPGWLTEAAASAEELEELEELEEEPEIEPAPEPEEIMPAETIPPQPESDIEQAEARLMDELESVDQAPELSQEAETPDWLKGYAEEISEPSEEIPEFEALEPDEEAEPVSEVEAPPSPGEPGMEGPAADAEPPIPGLEEPTKVEPEPEIPAETISAGAPDAEPAAAEAEPDWLGELGEERDLEPEIPAEVDAEAEVAETPEWLQEISEEPGISAEEAEAESLPTFAADLPESDEEIEWDEAAAAEEPDWLKEAEPEPESVEILEEPEIPDWLREPDEELMAGEPAVEPPAEEPEVEEIQPEPEFAKSDTKPLGEPEPPEPEFPAEAEVLAAREVEPELPAEPEPVEERPEVLEEPAPSEEAVPVEVPEVVEPAPIEREPAALEPAELLRAAQAALREGDYERAAEQYTQLTRKKQALNATIDDLEGTLEAQPGEPKLWTVLGDAYMQMDRIAEAIEAYQRGVEVI